MGVYYASKESSWQEEVSEHELVGQGLNILNNIDLQFQFAFELLEKDEYGYMSTMSYQSISGQINKCADKNGRLWDYARRIHGILEDKENDFHKSLSKAVE